MFFLQRKTEQSELCSGVVGVDTFDAAPSRALWQGKRKEPERELRPDSVKDIFAISPVELNPRNSQKVGSDSEPL